MTKVFITSFALYDDFEVGPVFTTEEKAREWIGDKKYWEVFERDLDPTQEGKQQ